MPQPPPAPPSMIEQFSMLPPNQFTMLLNVRLKPAPDVPCSARFKAHSRMWQSVSTPELPKRAMPPP
eukprot:scaffold55987_cov72-Phaeocystis_antarctica.AAC.10